MMPASTRLTCLLTHSWIPRSFPVLLDVERPFELQVGVLIVIDELGDGLVVATAEHARRRGLGLDWENVRTTTGLSKGCVRTLLLIEWLLLSAGAI
jgi:hypothetical protein